MNARHCLTWEQWTEFCQEHRIDPKENCEYGFDLGGGDSIEFYCYDDPPKNKDKEV
jgi:hypothetical protein